MEKLHNSESVLDEREIEYDLTVDPNISPDFFKWARHQNIESMNKLLLNSDVFSPYEISRQVHLNYALNILGTIKFGFFNRNLDKSLLEQYAQEFNEKDEIIKKLDMVAKKILRLEFSKNSTWIKKSNIFSLIIAFYKEWDMVNNLDDKSIKNKLKEFKKIFQQNIQ